MTIGAGREPRARSVSFLTFILRFTEPGGVTVPGQADADAATARERAHAVLDCGPDGQVLIPGTSLAGALRGLIRDERGEDVATEWFGRVPEPGGSLADTWPSQVWVLGSRRLDGDGSEFRASTRISRQRAAAEANTLRSEEVLPAGSRFEVFLRWDDPPAGAVEDLAGLLAGWRPFIGRGISRGRGACAVDAVRYGTLRLDQPGDLLRWLTTSGPELARVVAVTDAPAAGPVVPEPVLRVTVSIAGPWRTGNGEEPPGEGKPILLLRVGGKPVMPGSGIKGLLRSRAEFILRSAGVTPEPCDKRPCGKCWPCQVFGYGGGRDDAAESVGARALIRIPDAEVRDAKPACRTHIAIDRFTGGVLDGALYTMEVLEAGTFTLDVSPLGVIPEQQLWEIRAVLRLVLEDLNDGIIGLGGGVARGYGTVQVKDLDSESSFLPGLDEARAVLRQMARGE
jgi:CRISPR/Cas system CSM-associated protein Csm3 (group 7 of RAMP superfamily)